MDIVIKGVLFVANNKPSKAVQALVLLPEMLRMTGWGRFNIMFYITNQPDNLLNELIIKGLMVITKG